MKTTLKIRSVGNSKGVIIPKKYLDKCGISELVDVAIKGKVIILTAVKKTDKGNWASFKNKIKKEKVALISNKFDENEWTW